MYTAEIKGITLDLETDPELFSPSGADAGTLAMLSEIDFDEGDKVLDLGCGCGVVGILAAKIIGESNVTMCDISPKAVEISKLNAKNNGVCGVEIYLSDGLKDLPDRRFTMVLSNPPYHTDFSVAKHFIEDGCARLETGGRMVMVTKRHDWYKNKLISVFGGVRVIERDGYFVFISEKREKRREKKDKNKGGLSKKLRRKLKR